MAMWTRRELIKAVGAASAAAAVLPANATATVGPEDRWDVFPEAHRALRILFIGGTGFIGPHMVRRAQARGHSVTLFNRGRTNPHLFPDVEKLVGDRDGGLDVLRGGSWDAVIDNSGRQVEWTRASAELLRDRVDLYLYTSSTGVYYPYLGSNIREGTELVLDVPEDLDGDRGAAYGYGVMKANSEIAARLAFGDDRSITVRPTYIMGPADRTNRFAYWPVRLSRGGEILVPGKSEDPVQYIDVRDLTGWMIRLIENRTAGTFNAVGPASATGMHEFVYGAHAAFTSAASFVMVPDYEFLSEHRVGFAIPWIMPVKNNEGSALVSNRMGVEAGLTYTPLAESVRDIYEWWHSSAVTEERRTNMVSGQRSLMAREAEIIAAWKARR